MSEPDSATKRQRVDDVEATPPPPLAFNRVGGHFVARCDTPIVLSRHSTLKDPAVVQCIRRALTNHGVLCFPGQTSIDPEDEVALARCFDHDPTEQHPSESARLFGQQEKKPVDAEQRDHDAANGAAAACLGGEPWLEDVPEVRLVGRALVSDYHGTSGRVANTSDWAPEQRMWHQDGLADAKPAPPRVGTLRAVRVPSRGGETLFACTRRIARMLLEREAREEAAATAQQSSLDPPPSLARCTFRRHARNEVPLDGVAISRASGHLTTSHGPYPLIATDERGPFVIYNWNLESVVRPDGSALSPEESWAYARALLEPELGLASSSVYTHHWQDGELVLWDNLATIHTATAPCRFPEGAERLMHRVRLRTARPPPPYRSELPGESA